MSADPLDFEARESIESSPSDNGTVELAWEKDPSAIVVLEQADDAGFSAPLERYRGKDAGSVITGLAEGEHFFRIRYADGEDAGWSQPLRVQVEFYPRSKLFVLLGIGAVVVFLTISTIIYGAIRSRNEERRPA